MGKKANASLLKEPDATIFLIYKVTEIKFELVCSFNRLHTEQKYEFQIILRMML